MSPLRPEVIYAEQLGLKRAGYYGYPLWQAEPAAGLAADIGDVGYVSQGSWIRLFNVFKPADDAANFSLGFPSDSEYPLERGIGQTKPSTLPSKEPIFSNNVNMTELKANVDTGAVASVAGVGIGLGWNFTCSSSRGATLILHEKASRFDALEKKRYINLICQSAHQWLSFANDEPNARDIDIVDLVLITGYDRTCSWDSAAFDEESRNSEISFTLSGPAGAGEVSFGLKGKWTSSKSVLKNEGKSCIPDPKESTSETSTSKVEAPKDITSLTIKRPLSDNDHRNQAVFIRGYRVCSRLSLVYKWIRRIDDGQDGFGYFHAKRRRRQNTEGAVSSASPLDTGPHNQEEGTSLDPEDIRPLGSDDDFPPGSDGSQPPWSSGGHPPRPGGNEPDGGPRSPPSTHSSASGSQPYVYEKLPSNAQFRKTVAHAISHSERMNRVSLRTSVSNLVASVLHPKDYRRARDVRQRELYDRQAREVRALMAERRDALGARHNAKEAHIRMRRRFAAELRKAEQYKTDGVEVGNEDAERGPPGAERTEPSPWEILLVYILDKNEEADLAVLHDEDLKILGDKELKSTQELEEYLYRDEPVVHVVDSVAMLEPTYRELTKDAPLTATSAAVQNEGVSRVASESLYKHHAMKDEILEELLRSEPVVFDAGEFQWRENAGEVQRVQCAYSMLQVEICHLQFRKTVSAAPDWVKQDQYDRRIKQLTDKLDELSVQLERLQKEAGDIKSGGEVGGKIEDVSDTTKAEGTEAEIEVGEKVENASYKKAESGTRAAKTPPRRNHPKQRNPP
ncbi:hypothetical protein M422DRAFT_66584 [Sphaerobolus stellatus SS14]|nr:hypothetical protein M422DRAFT_66584 [Sphaerobolus stellatus SS14]